MCVINLVFFSCAKLSNAASVRRQRIENVAIE